MRDARYVRRGLTPPDAAGTADALLQDRVADVLDDAGAGQAGGELLARVDDDLAGAADLDRRVVADQLGGLVAGSML
jgi:hypothetical protein